MVDEPNPRIADTELEIYEVSEDAPVTRMHTVVVRTTGDSPARFEIEVEYEPEGFALTEESFNLYTAKYRAFDMNQEEITTTIHYHLARALGTDIFVRVTGLGEIVKDTWKGRP